jgi:hypothetical protein
MFEAEELRQPVVAAELALIASSLHVYAHKTVSVQVTIIAAFFHASPFTTITMINKSFVRA